MNDEHHDITPTPPPRGRFAGFSGVAEIVRFNRGMYVGAGATFAVGLAVLALVPLPGWAQVILVIGLALTAYAIVASLGASYWVYDRSGLTRWAWLFEGEADRPARWVNVHCGYDATTGPLRDRLPGSRGLSVDIYDPATMTEPSIARARAESTPEPGTVRGSYRALPVEDGWADAVFLLLAAHELRRPSERVELLEEAKRVLGPGGRVVLAEHLRDVPNFFAFGPGFTHFFSRRSWREAIAGAGLEPVAERRKTPFVGLFIARRRP